MSSDNFSNPGPQQARDSLYVQNSLLFYKSSIYPEAIRMAKTGDIIVRLGTDITSEIIRHLNLSNPSYSHAGIISRENDTVFVYHALGGELNPLQKLQRTPLWYFGHPSGNKALALYRLPLNVDDKKLLMSIVKDYYHLEIPFDTSFDLQTRDMLYCTEFVAAAFEQVFAGTLHFHRSVLNGKQYIAVDDITGCKGVQRVSSWEY